MNAECLEKETKTFPREIVEAIYVEKFDNKKMNFSESLTSNGCFEKDGNGRGRFKKMNATVNVDKYDWMLEILVLIF